MHTIQQKVLIVLSSLNISTALKWKKFFERLGSIEALWTNTQQLQDLITSVFDDYTYKKLQVAMTDRYFSNIMSEYDNNCVEVVTFLDDSYSDMLKEIADPPLVLYCKGDLDLLNQPSIGVVGTRKCSSYGKRVTEHFVSALCKNFCIVSGLANGIDSFAHKKAIELNAKTIAVLPGGFHYVYPSNNIQLAKQIAEVGLLVSEYPPSVEPTTYRFPMRNRIVSGLSKGIFVVEAPRKSGIFSTVESATQQNRDVFIVPGDIFSYASMGTNELLKNYRNTLVTCPDDIIKSYEINYCVKQKSTKTFAYQPTVEEGKILKLLSNGDKIDFDTIVEKTGLVASEVNYLLTNLELFDILTKLSGNFYQLKSEANNEINYS